MDLDSSPSGTRLQSLKQLPTRAQAITLPRDRQDAVAQALAFVRGDDTYDGTAVMGELQARVAAYLDPAGPAALAELAEHLPVLEALWLRFAAEAVAATGPDRMATMLRMALQAQAAYGRTLALVHGLAMQQHRAAQVSVIGDAT